MTHRGLVMASEKTRLIRRAFLFIREENRPMGRGGRESLEEPESGTEGVEK